MKVLLCVAIALVAASPAIAQTHITDHIPTSATWGIGGSPYIVHGEILVSGVGTILTIEPGVEIRFEPDAKLSIWSNSTIVAEGTSEGWIQFTSNSDTPAPNDWQSVYLYYAADPPSNNSSFSYCVFEYGSYNLYIDRSNPNISTCVFRRAGFAGIRVEVGSPQIDNCRIEDNPIGIHVGGNWAYPVIHHSDLCNNLENMYLTDYDETQNPVAEIHAENNWWGVDTYEEIGGTINIEPLADPYVDVLYDPWLYEAPVERTSWAGIKVLYGD